MKFKDTCEKEISSEEPRARVCTDSTRPSFIKINSQVFAIACYPNDLL